MLILKVMLKILAVMIQIPLTIIYFALTLIGSVGSGIGWIVGVVIFMITGICWLFGQFNAWYQPLIGLGIAAGVAVLPMALSEAGGSLILAVKKRLSMI